MPSPPNYISVSSPIICKFQKRLSDNPLPWKSQQRAPLNIEQMQGRCWRQGCPSRRGERAKRVGCAVGFLFAELPSAPVAALHEGRTLPARAEIRSISPSAFLGLCEVCGDFLFAVSLRRHLGPHWNWRGSRELIRPGPLGLKQTELVKLHTWHTKMIELLREKKTENKKFVSR